ncbi:MAG: imidazolonepropionase, partial [Thermoplasmata archaeon]
MSILIKNIGELFDGHMVMKDTCIFIEDGRIVSVGQEERADEVIDARKKLVMPGFIDPHTHAVFAGYR